MKLQAFDEVNILIPGIFCDSYFDSIVIATAFGKIKFFLTVFTSSQCQAGEFPAFVCPMRIL